MHVREAGSYRALCTMYNVNYVTEIEYIELFDRKKGGLPPFFSLLGAHIKCIFPSQIFGSCLVSSSVFCFNFETLKIDLEPFWEAKLGPCWPRFGVHVGPFHATLLVLAVKCIFQSNVQHTITLATNLL